MKLHSNNERLSPIKLAKMKDNSVTKTTILNKYEENWGYPTVLPAKSDSDVVFFYNDKENINLYTPLELMWIDRSLVY